MKNCCQSITKNGKVCKKYPQKNKKNCYIHRVKETCSICYDEINAQTTLHCGHFYCKKCISKWIYIQQNDTCPLCREIVSISEQYDAFEYCLDNQLISIYIYQEMEITENKIKDYLKNLLPPGSSHTYDNINWNIIINYLKANQEIYNLFKQVRTLMYQTYIIYDPDNPGTNIYGRNYIYNYRLNLI